ncbi:putative ribosomal RNA-processing protein 14-C [Cocos nucifera]|uniref:Putative ribosomal RNA-processing protein 14-C n=1 Tax=Cocos nucifera TaxID=13894 RepID=A0A8K0MY43_COCNU|nr:putative ribosomal RNA-processing protein 14-C [Cocos nucifera]
MKERGGGGSPSSALEGGELKILIHGYSVYFNHLVELIPARFYLPADDDKPCDSDENLSRSVTYEELRRRLHRRIEELRSNWNARPSEKKKEKKEKKKNQKNKKIKIKKAGEEAEPSSQGKRKRDEESEEEKGEKKKAKPEKGRDAASADLTFGQVKIGAEDDKKKKKKKLCKQQALERAKKLEEAKKDPEKGEKVSKKQSWKAAVRRAAGVKVHDDPKLLKESIKKEKKRQRKHAEKWKERMESVEKLRAEKQKKRTENIKERIHQKRMRRIEKREKKLMRP